MMLWKVLTLQMANRFEGEIGVLSKLLVVADGILGDVRDIDRTCGSE